MKPSFCSLNPFRKKDEALKKEISELRKQLEAYKKNNDMLHAAVSPVTDLGIRDWDLREVLKPMFEAYVPMLKTLIENEAAKKRQEASSRSGNKRISSTI
jgi:hypothetical protein